MNFTFELLGFCRDKDFKLTSFWIGGATFGKTNTFDNTEWNLFLIGRAQKKWILEVCGKILFGPKELFLKEEQNEMP